MDGKSMTLELGRARDGSLCSFLVFSTTFFGLNRSLASRRMGSLIRPLLSINRHDVKKLCRFWGLPIYPDVTNQTVAFSRNRIRKQLLPALRVALNPQVDSVLSQSAEIMLAERLQQDLLALKLLRAYQYLPRFERVGDSCFAWGQSPPNCPQGPHSPGEEEGNQAKRRPRGMERQSMGALIGHRHIKPRLGARWPSPAIEAPQPPEEPKRSLTSINMPVVRADYGSTLAVKSRGFGFGKTGAILGAKDSSHCQKQCIRLLHKRRGCLFLPQVGSFFTNSILLPVNVIQSF